MKRPSLIGAVGIALLLMVSACGTLGTENPLVTAKRGLTAASQSYNVICGSAFTLTGEAFNKAKVGCIAADDALDAADTALKLGDAATALARIQTANSRLAAVDTLTPK